MKILRGINFINLKGDLSKRKIILFLWSSKYKSCDLLIKSFLRLIFFSVHFLNKVLKDLFCNVSLKLHCTGKNSQSSKGYRPQSYFFSQLKSNKTLFFTMFSHLLQDKILNFFVFDQIFNVCFINTKFFSDYRKNIEIRMNHSDITVL